MTISELMIPEFDREMARTRKLLTKVPADKLDWTAGDGFRSIGWNANHISDLINWTRPIVEHDEFDIAPIDGPAPETPALDDPSEILAAFDRAVIDSRGVLDGVSDDTLAQPWALKSGGQTLFTISKEECLRTWVLNHTIHHRAILSVYLRMVGVELTPVYDE